LSTPPFIVHAKYEKLKRFLVKLQSMNASSKLFQPIIISEYHLLPSRIEVEDDLIDICTIGFLTVNDISQNSFSSKARVRGGLGLNFS
jgi:hypothetical protein